MTNLQMSRAHPHAKNPSLSPPPPTREENAITHAAGSRAATAALQKERENFQERENSVQENLREIGLRPLAPQTTGCRYPRALRE
jgi:hypothetical protein